MRKILTITSVLGASLTTLGVAHAATLNVGPGQQYATPCAAIAAAHPNDEVDVAAGTYTDSCNIGVEGLTLKGVGGQPKIDLSGTDHPADYKGIYVVSADNVRIENLELTGAHISDANGANGAGIRVQALGLVVHGCYIHDNQDGILGSPPTAGTGDLTVEYTQLYNNGLGDGCTTGGCTHNIYAGDFAKVVFQFNWSHHIATDTTAKGHLFKSRAEASYVLYNRLTDETGLASYELDLPNGGLGVVVGNVLEKGTTPNNPTLLTWGEEGGLHPDKRLFVVNNTFVNDYTSGTFINVASGGMLTAHNNLFSGPGTISSTGALSADNLSGVDPLFVDATNYDYHLQSGSPAIGKAVAPGSVDSFSLTPVFEYVQPLEEVTRASDLDVGAFEHGTVTTGAGQDGGAGTSDGGSMTTGGEAGTTTGGDAGTTTGRDAGTTTGADAATTGGGDAAASNGDAGHTTHGLDAGSSKDAGRRPGDGGLSGSGDAGSGPAGSTGGCAMTPSSGVSSAMLWALGLVLAAFARRRRADSPVA